MTNAPTPVLGPLPTGIIEITDRSIEEKVKDFSELLKTIENIDDKKRSLWKEIYENAVADRQNAYVMFTTLVRIAAQSSTEHATHAKSINSFIERMQRANEQLIRLVEQIAKTQSGVDTFSPDDMFEQIRSGR
jgi:hypothetical protein